MAAQRQTEEGHEQAPPPAGAAVAPRVAPQVSAVLDLQRGAGNAAVARLAAAGRLGPANAVTRSPAGGGHEPVLARNRRLDRQDPDPDIPPPTPEERQQAADELIQACDMKAREHRINTAQVCLVEQVDGTPGTAEITHLPAPYVRRRLEGRATNPALNTAFDAAVGRILGTGRRSAMLFRNRAYQEVPAILRLLESQFIHDPDASTLDLLGPDRSQHYRQDVNWGHEDYPGGIRGANQGQAVRMAGELSAIRPERRANSTDDRAIDETDSRLPRMREFIRSQLEPVDELSGFQLNKHARAQFEAMRAAARLDLNPTTQQGVELEPASASTGNFYRTPAASAAASASSGNAAAVAAGLSSHNLGLAVDLKMSFAGHNYAETTTRPMRNVVDMRQSPAHKWLFVRGARWGFYPYQNEPWHWEYNPPGFRDLLMREYREWLAANPAPAARGRR